VFWRPFTMKSVPIHQSQRASRVIEDSTCTWVFVADEWAAFLLESGSALGGQINARNHRQFAVYAVKHLNAPLTSPPAPHNRHNGYDKDNDRHPTSSRTTRSSHNTSLRKQFQ
jgi:hypothetical protein